ncbi:MAG TPA: hypothetical protein VHO90_11190 [Bacteroidales bacterium]|nr:hypothetical protein [Bacteroidales bacterium]
MKTKTHIFLLIVVLMTIWGCNPQKSKLKNRWIVLDDSALSADDRKTLLDLGHSLSIHINDFTSNSLSGSFIQFSSMGRYNLRMNTIYSEGTWKLQNDSMIMLVALTHDSIPLKIVSLKDDTVTLHFQTGQNLANYLNLMSDDRPVTFISDTISYLFDPNPYSYSMNKWARKSTHKLTDEEIRSKLLGYIEYLIVIIKDQRDNSRYLEKITNPIELAANGISLVKIDRVDPEWQNLFYDQEGFEKAFHILSACFNCNINVLQTTDLVELDSNILEQIATIIKAKKECN